MIKTRKAAYDKVCGFSYAHARMWNFAAKAAPGRCG